MVAKAFVAGLAAAEEVKDKEEARAKVEADRLTIKVSD